MLVVQSRLERGPELDVEDLRAVPAVLFRAVLRRVRKREEQLGIVRGVTIRRDSDTRGDVDRPSADLEWFDERLGDSLGDDNGFRVAVELVEQHGEFVAAQAGKDITAPQQPVDPPRDLDEEHVAGGVSE